MSVRWAEQPKAMLGALAAEREWVERMRRVLSAGPVSIIPSREQESAHRRQITYRTLAMLGARTLVGPNGTVYLCSCGARFEFMTTLAIHEIEEGHEQ